MSMEIERIIWILSLMLVAIVSLWLEVRSLRKRVRENLWAGQLMTWSEYLELPGALLGVPYVEVGDATGPDRKVMVYTRVFDHRPEAAK